MMHTGEARNRTEYADGEQPVKFLFLASVSLSEEGHPIKMRLSRVTGFLKDEISAWGKKHLSPFSLVVSDGLNCFPGVKEAKCDHEAVITHTENGYDVDKVFKWVNVMIGNVKNALLAPITMSALAICLVISQNFVIVSIGGLICIK
jgi:hypothetical protein